MWWSKKPSKPDFSFYQRLATHDLHFHYDGSISKEVVRRAFQKNDWMIRPAEDLIVRTLLNSPIENPDEFFKCFDDVRSVFGSRGDIQPLLDAQIDLEVEEGIKHLDYRFGCGALSKKFGYSEGMTLAHFSKAFARAKEQGLDVCPTLCFSRYESMNRANLLFEFVLESRLVIRAVDLEGPESQNTTAAFGPMFRKLKEQGLRVTVHAGEFSGPRSVWQAIDDCGAERIGHGFSAASDTELLKRLAKDQIPMEVCLSSNYLMGLCKDLKRHPFLKFLEAGIPVVLCTDDQAIFQTSLAKEYEKAAEIITAAGLRSELVLKEISENGHRFAFTGRVS